MQYQYGGYWYPKSFVRRVRAIYQNHGAIVTGMFLCYNKVPALVAVRMLGL